MIIGIDGYEANIKKRVGVGRYAFELLKQLSFASRRTNFKFQIYLKDLPLPDMPEVFKNWHYRVIGPKKFWTQTGLPLDIFLNKPRPDVFFNPSHYLPLFLPCPAVISIMDLSYLYFPEAFRKQDFYKLKFWTAYTVKKASRILTISTASKRDIIRYYHVSTDKVVVTYPGFNMKLKVKSEKLKVVREKYGITGDYILSVGTLQPRKNYVRLIEAFANLNPNISLVIVGKKGWLWKEILAAPKKFGVESRVKFLDFVSDEELAVLYKGAKCFVLVSLYEGFGIPILEAMNFGCPVVASNVSSLPEVVGEAGILVDPENVLEIAEGIKKAISQRDELVKKGYQQAKKFSWEKTARQTLEVLKEVANV